MLFYDGKKVKGLYYFRYFALAELCSSNVLLKIVLPACPAVALAKADAEEER